MFNIHLIIDIVVDFIYPPRCAGCDKILKKIEIKSGFCKQCRAIIETPYKDECLLCGKKLLQKDLEYCFDCRAKGHNFTQAKSVYVYDGIMKNSMYRFKYSGKKEYANTYARDAYKLYERWLNSIKPNYIIPVPMYKGKERKRGYNQALAFADELSKVTGIPCEGDAFVRVKNTKPLKMLSPTERRLNLKNAFKKVKDLPKNADILIVDDIFTTGTTVDELSRLLIDEGVNRIYCLFICTGKAKK